MTTYEQTTQKPFRGKSRFFQKRKVCHFCMNKISYIDYKDTNTLRRYISDQNRIESSRKTGVCPKHQRALSSAIKRARILALVPSDGSHGSGRLSARHYQSQDRSSENSYQGKKSDSKIEAENPGNFLISISIYVNRILRKSIYNVHYGDIDRNVNIYCISHIHISHKAGARH